MQAYINPQTYTRVGGGGGGEMSLSKVFLSFLPEDNTSASDFFSSC